MVIFLIPAYNDAENIHTLLSKTNETMLRERLSYKLIIINDGSTDDTVKVVESFKDKMPVEIYSHYPNKGTGEAFRVGFAKALAMCAEGDIIVTKEADNTSDLSILPQLISKVSDGYDVALASCYAKGGGVVGATPYRFMLSKVANVLLKLFFPMESINTYTSFYRAFSYKALREIFKIYGEKLIEESGFECMAELLIKFSRSARFRITEVPMTLDVTKRIGKSKMKIFRTIKGILKIIVKEAIIYRVKQCMR